MFDDPVLERVKRDHRQPAAAREPAPGRLDESLEAVEFLVHPDPQRLERPGRRIDPLPSTSAGGPPHHRGEGRGIRQIPAIASCDDRARHTPRMPFFVSDQNPSIVFV